MKQTPAQEGNGIFDQPGWVCLWPAFVDFLQRTPTFRTMELEEEGVVAAPGCGAAAQAAYLSVLRAFGSSPQRVQQVVDQLVLNANHDEHAYICWQRYFSMMRELHDKYASISAEQRTNPDNSTPPTRALR